MSSHYPLKISYLLQALPQSILRNAAPEHHQATLQLRTGIVCRGQIRPESNFLLMHTIIIIVENKELHRWKSP